MAIKTFWCEPIEFVELALRRYRSIDDKDPTAQCPGRQGYHNAFHHAGKFPITYGERKIKGRKYLGSRDDDVEKDDHRWPTKCDNCDYRFIEQDQKQVFQEHVYRRVDTGEEFGLRHAPVGAMWDAWWYGKKRLYPDGIHLMVKLPNDHEWSVDHHASNCDSPCKNCKQPRSIHKYDRCPGYEDMNHNDKQYRKQSFVDTRPEHSCWVRHGDPKTGIVTVDKNGNSCGAGAGGIRYDDLYMFLRDGYIVNG